MKVNVQRDVCMRFGADFFGCDLSLKVGVARNVQDGLRPLNGLRLQPGNDVCGWYLWAGDEFSHAEDFFVPLHGIHLKEWAPLVIPYLGLPPGWRFLITEQYEDAWEDPQLLESE
ncbi:hypothetical protein AAGS40_30425 (plasmid) [Paraburkholderia sp. PREW-6R]|uniref:immunity protein Imm33 domain-containing protein n=1 Tax=Paraburkholderia sp. PREW-6R TaxID=3141544 RepID=UPI0031F4E01A